MSNHSHEDCSIKAVLDYTDCKRSPERPGHCIMNSTNQYRQHSVIIFQKQVLGTVLEAKLSKNL